MKLVVVSVWDSAAQAYNRPIFVPTKGVALRSFTDEVNRKAADNPLNAHPEDYELRILAEFEEETGVFQVAPEGVGACLARGKDVAVGQG